MYNIIYALKITPIFLYLLSKQKRSQPMKQQKTIMIIAGEASGDTHGAHLVEAIKQKKQNIQFVGLGGDHMKAAGVELYVHLNELSVVGITEVFARRGGILAGLRQAKEMLRNMRPDLLILIDFPDFNMIVARTAKNLGIPILYYISPQVWAWRSGRVKKIKRLVDHMAVILPFEADFYRKHHVPVTYVGHPLLEHPVLPPVEKESEKQLTIGLLPGSRAGEVQNLLPIMVQAADYMAGEFQDIQFVIPRAPTIESAQIQDILSQSSFKNSPQFSVVDAHAQYVNQISNLVIVASGTATLEVALSETPMIIIYKVSKISYTLVKVLVNVSHIGLANLVAGQRVVPELIQDEATPENVFVTARQMLNDPGHMQKIQRKLKMIRQRLGGPGASQKTADIAFQLLKKQAL